MTPPDDSPNYIGAEPGKIGGITAEKGVSCCFSMENIV
jgi:hypothetical protein